VNISNYPNILFQEVRVMSTGITITKTASTCRRLGPFCCLHIFYAWQRTQV